MEILESLEGFVDKFDKNGIAYITLHNLLNGDVLYGECPIEQLTAHGIRERRRFKCDVMEDGTILYEDIPDKVISCEEERAIRKRIEEMIPDDEITPQDD